MQSYFPASGDHRELETKAKEMTPREKYSDDRCYEIFRQARWPKGIVCPYCTERRVTTHSKFAKTSRRRYLCLRCRKTFTDLTGTPFARTNLPLRTWFYALDLVRSGMKTSELAKQLRIKWDTAAHIQRRIGVSTAGWSLIHHLREAVGENRYE